VLNFLYLLYAAVRAYREAGRSGTYMMKIHDAGGCSCVVEVSRFRDAILFDEAHRELRDALEEVGKGCL
jgi:hypothetical protein